MRPVSGFDRPIVQWGFVALGVVLIAVSAAEAFALRRARVERDRLRAAELNARVQQDQLENRLTREQSTRESLVLELARRTNQNASPAQPTLTLTPLSTRGAAPPQATVVQPPAAQSIQLRLLLPPGRRDASARYNVIIRTWSEGETVWQRGGLVASTADHKAMVAPFITGDVFAPGAYEVALLSGTPATEVASYEVGVGTPK